MSSAQKTLTLDKDEQQSWTTALATLLKEAEKKEDKGEKLVAYNSIAEHARWRLKQLQSRRAQYGNTVVKRWVLGLAGFVLATAAPVLVTSAIGVALPVAVALGLAATGVAAAGGVIATPSVKKAFLNSFDKQHK